MERDKHSRTDTMEGTMGRRLGGCQVVLPICSGDVRRSSDGRMVFRDRYSFVFVPAHGMVCVGHLLYEEPDRHLSFVQ